jgi:SRSO17 transposase
LVDRRLFLPEAWFSEEYCARRATCGVPDDRAFRTHTEVAWELLAPLQARQVLPFQWVLCDEGVGKDPAFLDQIAAAKLFYLAEVPHNTRVWQVRPATAVPPATGRKGRPCRKERLAPDAPPLRVDALAAHIPPQQWQRYQIKEGAKGPLVAEFAFLRVVAVRERMPGAACWLVLRRSLDEPADLKTYLSNAPARMPLIALVEKSGMRWPVESAILESKSEVGMDHYEVRGWVGWRHHMTMSLLAHHFLVRQHCRLGGKISGVNRAAGAAPPASGLTQTGSRRRNSDCAHALHPGAKLCGVSLPPEANARPPRHLITK